MTHLFKQLGRTSVAFVLACGLAACGQNAANPGDTPEEASSTEASASAEEVAVSGTFEAVVTGYDWGCGVNQALVTLDRAIDSVSPDDFTVIETKQAVDFTDFSIVEQEMPRTVTGAYLADAAGKPVSGPSNTLVIELAVSPYEGSPLYLNMALGCNSFSDPYALNIQLTDTARLASDGAAVSSLSIAPEAAGWVTSADAFALKEFEASDGVAYHYATYEPETASDTLVVWLHGLGEGGYEGTDPRIVLLSAKSAAFAGEEFQQLVGGANVLVPQCPTYWMDADGQKGNYVNGEILADGSSFYTDSLEELIDTYAAEVGATKIVLAGCSNGGYMTMVLALHRPSAYAAIVPVCEAMASADISDEQIASLTDLPAFFVWSEDDQTVDPSQYEQPTVERLRAAGAKELHVSTTDQVVDTSGTIETEDGSPYRYEGHYSWVYFLNNESACDEDGLGAWEFIAQHVQ